MYQCKNCHGKLIYSLEKQKLFCESCDSLFSVEDYPDEAMTAQSSYEINTFICPQCNGQIFSDDEQAVGFCPYCGSQVGLEKHIVTTEKPKYIIPFFKTKKVYQGHFMDVLERKPFLPREMKRSGSFGDFIGIYLPVWLYNGHYSCHLFGHGHDPFTGESYTMEFDYEGDFQQYPKDASLYFDDDLTDLIFSTNGMKPFHSSYLCGFYADLATVPADRYRDTVLHEFLSHPTVNNPFDDLNDTKSEDIQAELEKSKDNAMVTADLVMFPVWFMTYRSKKRVSYGFANGATGEVAVDLPVDMKAFLLSTCFKAIPIFLAMLLFTMPFSPFLLNSFVWFMSLVAILISMEIQQTFYFKTRVVRTGNLFRLREATIGQFIWIMVGGMFSLATLVVLHSKEPAPLAAVLVAGGIRLLIPSLLLPYGIRTGLNERISGYVLLCYLAALLTAVLSVLTSMPVICYVGVSVAALMLSGAFLRIANKQKEICSRKLPYFSRGKL